MPNYIPNEGLRWSGVLKGTAKAANLLQPLFEAFTNSLEAIDMRRKSEEFAPYIRLDFYFNSTIDNNNDGLVRLIITDNGIGFDDKNFTRLQIFKDDTKGYDNRGSGRIQLIHSFRTATYQSIYKQDGICKYRRFVLSKSNPFLEHNAILSLEEEKDINSKAEIKTELILDELREKSDVKFYNSQSIQDIKDVLINHYILYFCVNRNSLPQIFINYYHGTNIIASRTIAIEDIPTASHEDEKIHIPISQMSSDMKRIESSNNNVDISIKSYKLPQGQLKKNAVKVTCKGEVIDSVRIKLECLPSDMQIDSSHFLFLLSSPYFDDRVGDTRDTLEILNKTEFKKRAKQFGSIEPQIILDDLEAKISDKASEMYKEIASQQEAYERQLAALKQTYLLSDAALEDADINDSVEDILKKAYTYDARLVAERDAAYHTKLEELNELDTCSPTYKEDLQRLVDDLTRSIPLQDKESLSRYVTHRRLVLDLMSKILNRTTTFQNIKEGRNEDEKLLHNLLFTQHSEETGNSDLWMLNEDYLYYKGYSEHRLNQIVINGKKLFREEITEEEERYLTSLGEDRRIKRPDILLFPAERKCVIVELKTPNTNLSLHLNQINKYAYFLRNFTSNDFIIDTFYGYLIGEALEYRDVRGADGRFKFDPKFNFMYLPNAPVVFEDDPTGKQDGSLYMEVLTYSVILKRAERRNEAFTIKLFPKLNEEEKINQKDIVDNNEEDLFS